MAGELPCYDLGDTGPHEVADGGSSEVMEQQAAMSGPGASTFPCTPEVYHALTFLSEEQCLQRDDR